MQPLFTVLGLFVLLGVMGASVLWALVAAIHVHPGLAESRVAWFFVWATAFAVPLGFMWLVIGRKWR